MIKKLTLALILLIIIGFIALTFIKLPAPENRVEQNIPLKIHTT